MTPPMTPREKVEPSLNELLRQAVETMKSWTPEQREAHFEAQKKAWVAAEMAFGDEGTRVITALASGSGDHAELARLADAATQGPWKACGTIYEHMNCEVRGGTKGEGQAIAQVWDGPNAFKDGQFIAAADPATIKRLIASLRAPSREPEGGAVDYEAVRIATDLHTAFEKLIYGLPKYLDAENLTDEENMIREAWITLDVTAHRLAALATREEATAEAGEVWPVGSWLSAALDDPKVCDEMKADIRLWFDGGGHLRAQPQARSGEGQ